MNIKKATALSVLTASLYTLFDAFYMKVGGLMSGGIRKRPHTWNEIIDSYPTFIFTFVIFFIVLFIWNKLTPETYYYICTNCEEGFSDLYKQKEITCTKCGGKAEPSDGFYERHPELLTK